MRHSPVRGFSLFTLILIIAVFVGGAALLGNGSLSGLAAAVTTAGSSASSTIAVTAPNGGEQWEEGVLNTVTWAPYQYDPDINPAKDVTAYLEKKSSGPCLSLSGCYTVVGKVEESGKASIHWITGELDSKTKGGIFAPPGSGYYVRVVNNVTKKWDRSDKPFTLLPKPVDIKINGSDGPLTLSSRKQSVSATWKTTGASGCSIQIAGGATQKVGAEGSTTLSVDPTANPYVLLICDKTSSSVIKDYVYLNAGPTVAASLKVTSPNGGEKLVPGTPYTIRWAHKGLTNPIAIALYKDDKWFAWINKNVENDKSVDGTYSYSWTPEKSLAAGSGYKIYITGKKADGSGYLEDKSDSTFSIGVAARPVCGLFRGGTSQAKNMIASPNPASSVADTDAACIEYCDASGWKAEDICMRGDAKIKVYSASAKPDLIASKTSTPDAKVGKKVAVSAIVSNIGKGIAAETSYTRFQIASDASGTGAKVIGQGEVGKLNPGGSAGPTTYYTFPAAGTVYARACADLGAYGSVIDESNESNNCGAWTAITVAPAGGVASTTKL